VPITGQKPATLAAGQRLGPFEIQEPLGAGGMGEVYKARDTRLDRDIALKVLPDRLSRDAEALGRFEREAKALAALDHPYIAGIHGLEEASGFRFLVLELVPGESLSERLTRGRPPLGDALRIAARIAEGLEAAHDRGILHRDLKPGNVQVTADGGVKLLDFGLAKNVASEQQSEAETLTKDPETREGTVLGTPAYMSPEQSRAMPVDRRTDIWSLGCILYELLAGKRVFQAPTVSDTVAAVLSREPDWSALPSDVPPSIRHILHRCLEKDVNHRLRDVGDLRLELEEALAQLKAPRPPRAVAWRSVGWAAALGVALLALVVWLVLRARGGPITPPQLAQVTSTEGVEEFPAFAPDGARVAYSAEKGGVRKIVVKSLSDGRESVVTSGDRDDIQPAWSPDGNRLLFVRGQTAERRLEPGDVFGRFTGGDVFALDLDTRAEKKLLDNAFNPAWSPDGKSIAVDAVWAGPARIWVVDSGGHNPVQVTSDASEAVEHLRPRWSPDGRRIVFQNLERTRFAVRVVDVTSKATTFVTKDAFRDLNPVWSPRGRSIYFTSDRGGGLNIWRLPVDAEGRAIAQAQQLTTGAGQDVEPAFAPDGKRVAFVVLKQNADLWRLPVSPETGHAAGDPERLIGSTREDSRGEWSPDGRTIVFNSDRDGDMNLWLYDVATRAARPLTRGAGGDYQPVWSPDGKRVVFFSSRGGTLDVWSVDVASGELQRLTSGEAVDVNPFFSPDGRRIAYQSDEGGHLEVWVMDADGGHKRQLTQTGVSGHFLRWTSDGASVLYRCPCGGKSQSMLVPVDGGEPRPTAAITGGAHMSFSPDGKRVMDVVAHKVLWVSPLDGGAPEQVFQFADPTARIDYPVWSPDGRAVLFDRYEPQGGDVWMMSGLTD
jgi:Tol biopolymer transport system component/tRNA A-37 threonylcarbamoyl transferase component Bud32